ncbi:MAG: cytidylate kinase-like family protein [bacterium]|nr:cytidylate kinase-like family protein [bacterium]
MSAKSLNDSGAAKLVERQMRNWEIARSQRGLPAPEQPREVEDFVALSRAVGADLAGSGQVAATLGERLGWPVFDKEILHTMADDDRLRTRLYESMDERDLGWFEETVRSLMPGAFKKNDYYPRLTATILSLARQGRAVFVGRAADLILPPTHGLRVRLTAPPATCVANFAQQNELDIDRAEAEVKRIEAERADFIRRHFGIEAAEQSRHDLIVNVDRFTPAQTVTLILEALQMRGLAG